MKNDFDLYCRLVISCLNPHDTLLVWVCEKPSLLYRLSFVFRKKKEKDLRLKLRVLVFGGCWKLARATRLLECRLGFKNGIAAGRRSCREAQIQGLVVARPASKRRRTKNSFNRPTQPKRGKQLVSMSIYNYCFVKVWVLTVTIRNKQYKEKW